MRILLPTKRLLLIHSMPTFSKPNKELLHNSLSSLTVFQHIELVEHVLKINLKYRI